MIFQVLVVTYAIFTLLTTFWRRHTRRITFWLFSGLSVSHLGILWVTLFPYSTYPIANFFGIGRGADFIVYTAILIILRILFYLYSQNRSMEQKLTQIVRHLALTEDPGDSERS